MKDEWEQADVIAHCISAQPKVYKSCFYPTERGFFFLNVWDLFLLAQPTDDKQLSEFLHAAIETLSPSFCLFILKKNPNLTVEK